LHIIYNEKSKSLEVYGLPSVAVDSAPDPNFKKRTEIRVNIFSQ